MNSRLISSPSLIRNSSGSPYVLFPKYLGTYNLFGDELDGPRGRIYLIKDMLEKNKPANDKIVKHIDRCLSCYACMTTCPSGVNYMHLIDHGRSHIEKTYKRPLQDRIIRNFLSTVLPNTFNFRLMLFLLLIAKPFSFLFPKKIKEMIKHIPKKFPKSTNMNIAKINEK